MCVVALLAIHRQQIASLNETPARRTLIFQLETASNPTQDHDYGESTCAFPMDVFLKVIETSSCFLLKREC